MTIEEITDIVTGAFYEDYNFNIQRYPDGSTSSIDKESVKAYVEKMIKK